MTTEHIALPADLKDDLRVIDNISQDNNEVIIGLTKAIIKMSDNEVVCSLAKHINKLADDTMNEVNAMAETYESNYKEEIHQ